MQLEEKVQVNLSKTKKMYEFVLSALIRYMQFKFNILNCLGLIDMLSANHCLKLLGARFFPQVTSLGLITIAN